MIPISAIKVMKMGEKLQGLQEEKHQLFLQLKKVLHEEEKRRRKEQRYFRPGTRIVTAAFYFCILGIQ